MSPELMHERLTWRRMLATLIGTLLLAGAIAVAYAALRARPPVAAPVRVSTGAAPVDKGTVTERVNASGTWSFDGTDPVIYQGPAGVLTSVAAAGSTVRSGQSLFSISGQRTYLLPGSTPAYRSFEPGMTNGPDVRELEEFLARDGFARGLDMTVDEQFTALTQAAVRRLQAHWHLAPGNRSGRLPLGSVIFAPAPLRVGPAQAVVGGLLPTGATVFTGTSTRQVVQLAIDPDRQELLQLGDIVVVDVATGSPVTGRVTRIGAGPSAPADSSTTTPADAPTTVLVTVAVPPPTRAQRSGRTGAVSVAITTARHTAVLNVPVSALLASPGGGYEVRLVGGGSVAVNVGLFDDLTGRVEVSGTGLAAGQLVEVPT